MGDYIKDPESYLWKQIMITKNASHHVLKNPSGGWSVKKGGATRASYTYKTLTEAISSAKNITKKQGTRLIIHHNDGRIRKTHDYMDNFNES